jgi:hypothetical protein
VGEMAEKKKTRKVRILDKKKIVKADALRVVVKGGNIIVLKVFKPLNKRQLVLQDGDGAMIVTSINRLAQDIEEYLRVRGMEPIYIYPAFQQTLPE